MMGTGHMGEKNTGLQNMISTETAKIAKLLMKDYFDEQSQATNSFWSGFLVA